MFKFDRYHFRYYNVRLILFSIVLAVTGILFVRSATMNSHPTTFYKQIFGVALGIVIMIITSLIDYHWLLKFFWAYYIISIGLLVFTLVKGISGGGAQRWIEVPGIGIVQPSEFSKILMILFFAWFFSRFHESISKIHVLLIALVLFGVQAALILKQPNLSTTLITTIIFLCMLYTAGISYKWVGGVLAVMIPGAIWFVYAIQQEGQKILEDYQVKRIMSWVSPSKYAADVTLQQRNSIMAIGSGQLYGKGLANTTFASVKNGNFLSEEDTDFIFAVIGEESGFIGSVIIIALLVVLVIECMYMAARAKDLSGKLICMGMASLIAFQSFVNIGVATGVLPNTGVPLPFISAGLSSLLSIFIGMGLVLNVGLQRSHEISRGGFSS